MKQENPADLLPRSHKNRTQVLEALAAGMTKAQIRSNFNLTPKELGKLLAAEGHKQRNRIRVREIVNQQNYRNVLVDDALEAVQAGLRNNDDFARGKIGLGTLKGLNIFDGDGPKVNVSVFLQQLSTMNTEQLKDFIKNANSDPGTTDSGASGTLPERNPGESSAEPGILAANADTNV